MTLYGLLVGYEWEHDRWFWRNSWKLTGFRGPL